MRLPRFRLRTLMIAVAAVALALCIVTPRRWAYCWARAKYHEREEVATLAFARMDPKILGTQLVPGHRGYYGFTMKPSMAANWDMIRSTSIRRARQHAEHARSFRRAMWCFWLPVPRPS